MEQISDVKEEARVSFVGGKYLSKEECIEQAFRLTFSVDLVEAALAQVEFLAEVNQYPSLYEINNMINSRRRYEKLWLPLAAEHAQERLAAPLDIEWVWHCHLLCPLMYEKDCQTLFGTTINHRLFRSADREHALKRSKHLWEAKHKNEPFEIDLASDTMKEVSSKTELESSILYDINGAISRQRYFYYNVSLPHYRDMRFLTLAMHRYQKFLFLRKNSYKLFIVPCYDQDLMWHTHQLHPLAYREDTIRILGKVLHHDDTTVDRSPNSKLTLSTIDTSRLWLEMYQESFNTAGAMYRGKTPEELYSPPNPLGDRAYSRTGRKFSLESMSIDRIPDGEYGLDFTLQIFLADDFRKISKPQFEVFGPSMLWTAEDLFSCELESKRWLVFRLKIRKGTIFSREVTVGIGKVDLQEFLDHSTVFRFNDSVSLDGDDKNRVYISGCITDSYTNRSYSLVSSDFSVCSVPHDIDSIFSIESTNLDPQSCGAGYIARHRFIGKDGAGDVECRFVYNPHRSNVDIQFIQNDRIVCSAKPVDSFHLPLSSQVSNPNWFATWDPRLGERAVMIRQASGDWGVLTGRWISPQNGTDDYLLVKFHKVVDRSTQFINIPIPKTKGDHFDVRVDNNVFDMESSDFNLTCSQDDSLPYLATGMSISLLVVMCRPRSDDTPVLDKTETDANLKDMHHLENFELLLSCGLNVIQTSRHSSKAQTS